MKIDWDKVWKEYEKFHQCYPDFLSYRKKKIQSLVEAQLKPKRRKK